MPEIVLVINYPANGNEPAFTEVRRMEFDTIEAMQDWLFTRPVTGLVSEEKLVAEYDLP